MSDRDPRIWAIVGATGTGKSDLALRLAEALHESGNPAEIVNADAMQLYRGMDVGTAKLSVDERRGIPHHLFDVREVTQDAAVAWYQPLARAAIETIHARGGDAVLVGGSGLYVSSVIFDFRFPPRDPAVRQRLERELDEQGAGALFARLQQVDAVTAARVDPKNGRRIVRALEVIEQGAQTHGAALPDEPLLWHPRTRILGVEADRAELVARLDARVERMWEQGMLEEAAPARGRDPTRHHRTARDRLRAGARALAGRRPKPRPSPRRRPSPAGTPGDRCRGSSDTPASSGSRRCPTPVTSWRDDDPLLHGDESGRIHRRADHSLDWSLKQDFRPRGHDRGGGRQGHLDRRRGRPGRAVRRRGAARRGLAAVRARHARQRCSGAAALSRPRAHRRRPQSGVPVRRYRVLRAE